LPSTLAGIVPYTAAAMLPTNRTLLDAAAAGRAKAADAPATATDKARTRARLHVLFLSHRRTAAR
jgi:hypothetical protein